MKKTDYEAIFELYDKGLSWDEIREELPWFTDTDRKKFYGYKEAMDLVGANSLDDRLQKRQQTIRLQRKVLGYERAINNEQIRDIALSKVLQRQLQESLKDTPPFTLKEISKHKTKNGDKSYIFTTGDFHYDGNRDEAEWIFEEVLFKIKEKVEQFGIKHIYLAEMGDLIEGAGNLRASQAQAVKTGMIPQMVEAMKLYAMFINELSKFVKVTFIVVTSSNHTQLRLMGSKQNELVEEDLMIIFAEYIRAMFPKMEIIADTEPKIDLNGFKVLFKHGHTVKGKAQAEREIQDASAFHNEIIDFLFLGHYHHFRTIDIYKSTKPHLNTYYDKRVFFLPTLDIHMSNFEKDRKLSSTPGIGFFEFDSKQGNTFAQKITIGNLAS